MSKSARWPKKPSRFVIVTVVASLLFDLSGIAFGLFYEGVFYDNLAHFLTSFALVSLAAELAQKRRGALPLLASGRHALSHALIAGAVVGFVGGGAWEIVEIMADFAFPVFIYNPPLDTATDMAFGTLGGAVGAWRTNAVYPASKPTRRWLR